MRHKATALCACCGLALLLAVVTGARGAAAAVCSARPTVAAQPQSRTVLQSQTATFTVAEGDVSSGCAAAGVQWQVSTNAGETFTELVASSTVSGVTDPTLTLTNTTTAMGGREYEARLTNAFGVTTSSPAILTVDLAEPVFGATPATPVSAPAAGPHGAAVTYAAPTAKDPVTGAALQVTCSPPSGSLFPADATTTVTCAATDVEGNTGTTTFGVDVYDPSPPAVTVPASVTVDAPPGATTAGVFGLSASATDLVDGTDAVICSPSPTEAFPIGTTTVSCSATNKAGLATTATFTVTVIDTTKPDLDVPPNITVSAASPAGTAVVYAASATDLVDGPLTPSCSPPPASVFPVGATTVTCTATDKEGNEAISSFTITVLAPSGAATTAARHEPSRAAAGAVTLTRIRTAGRAATVSVACGGSRSARCALKLELAATTVAHRRRRTLIFAAKAITMAGGTHETVSLRLDAAGVTEVRRRVTVELIVAASGGRTTTHTLTFRR